MDNQYSAYGKYAKIRNATWELLIKHDIRELPVDIISIAIENGIHVVKNGDMNILKQGENGVSIVYEDSQYIIYDESKSKNIIQFTIAHETGHYFLGHPLIEENGFRKFDASKPKKETEADMFAVRLLTPMCIFHELGVQTLEEFTKISGLPPNLVKPRYERYIELEQRNKYYTSKKERILKEQFELYIKEKIPQLQKGQQRDFSE